MTKLIFCILFYLGVHKLHAQVLHLFAFADTTDAMVGEASINNLKRVKSFMAYLSSHKEFKGYNEHIVSGNNFVSSRIPNGNFASNDVCIIYISSHGGNPANVNIEEFPWIIMKDKLVRSLDIEHTVIAKTRPKLSILLIDACSSYMDDFCIKNGAITQKRNISFSLQDGNWTTNESAVKALFTSTSGQIRICANKPSFPAYCTRQGGLFTSSLLFTCANYLSSNANTPNWLELIEVYRRNYKGEMNALDSQYFNLALSDIPSYINISTDLKSNYNERYNAELIIRNKKYSKKFDFVKCYIKSDGLPIRKVTYYLHESFGYDTVTIDRNNQANNTNFPTEFYAWGGFYVRALIEYENRVFLQCNKFLNVHRRRGANSAPIKGGGFEEPEEDDNCKRKSRVKFATPARLPLLQLPNLFKLIPHHQYNGQEQPQEVTTSDEDKPQKRKRRVRQERIPVSL